MRASGTSQRIVVMTMHKSASMLFVRLLGDIAKRSGLPYWSEHAGNLPTHWRLETDAQPIAAIPHGVFGPLRSYADVANLPGTSVLLQLRDPRDLLVSLYYSFAFSHPAPKDTDVGPDRSRWQEMGIDQFILSDPVIWGPPQYRRSFGWRAVLARYNIYIERLLGRSNVTVLRYEDIYRQFDTWSEQLLAAFDPLLNQSDQAQIRQMLRLETAPPETEQPNQHKRKMLPGDYREKLAPSTIDFLNREFSQVLKQFDWH